MRLLGGGAPERGGCRTGGIDGRIATVTPPQVGIGRRNAGKQIRRLFVFQRGDAVALRQHQRGKPLLLWMGDWLIRGHPVGVRLPQEGPCGSILQTGISLLRALPAYQPPRLYHIRGGAEHYAKGLRTSHPQALRRSFR